MQRETERVSTWFTTFSLRHLFYFVFSASSNEKQGERRVSQSVYLYPVTQCFSVPYSTFIAADGIHTLPAHDEDVAATQGRRVRTVAPGLRDVPAAPIEAPALTAIVIGIYT